MARCVRNQNVWSDRRVSPDEIRGWRLGNEVFLRTRHTLMSPPWSASERGAGNVTVYALPSTPFALLSIDGRTTSVALKA